MFKARGFLGFHCIGGSLRRSDVAVETLQCEGMPTKALKDQSTCKWKVKGRRSERQMG